MVVCMCVSGICGCVHVCEWYLWLCACVCVVFVVVCMCVSGICGRVHVSEWYLWLCACV